MITGYFYLHINGDLIFKREGSGIVADIRESNLAIGLWPMDPENREHAWTICIEGLASGANKERIMGLAARWGCDNGDAEVYATRVNVTLQLDGNMWCATRKDFENLQESPAGFGPTKLEAMADLCKTLGYKPSKMWGASFKDLLTLTTTKT